MSSSTMKMTLYQPVSVLFTGRVYIIKRQSFCPIIHNSFSSPLFHVVSQTRAEEVISVLRGLPAASIMYQQEARDSSL